MQNNLSVSTSGQVRAMWEWVRDLDRQNLLWCEFCRPIEIEPGSKEDIAIQLTEGWILGASPTVRHLVGNIAATQSKHCFSWSIKVQCGTMDQRRR
jgi:hypothetical protein